MRQVPSSFHDLARGNVRPHSWGLRISFDKSYDDDVTFFTLNQSQLNGGDILAPVDDNVVQAWDFYNYKDYTDRVTHMSWDRTLEFPYSVASARADFELANTDNYFTPRPTPPIVETNHSKNPSFELGTGSQVEVRRNILPNPNLSGSVLGGAGTGITISVPTANERRVVINNPTGNYWSIVPFLGGATTVAGATYTMSLEIKRTGGGTTPPRFYLNPSAGYMDMTGSVGTDWSTIHVTFTNGAVTPLQAHLGWSSVANGTYDVRRFKLEQIGTLLPYFDGSYNTWQSPDLTPSWTGTANNSASVLMGEEVMGASIWPLQNTIWLSSDGANHGSRFARGLVKQTSSNIVTYGFNDVEGIIAGETQTNAAFVRASTPQTSEVRWQTQTGTGGGSTVAGNHNITTSWTEAKFTGQSTFNNSPLSFYVQSPAIGTLLDIDNHYAIKGTYTGGYFDGSSGIDYEWRTQANNSISYQRESVPGIGRYTLPKRPVRLLSGFRSMLIPQFVGLTQGMPDISEQSKTATFTALDFLTQIFDTPIRETIAMRDVRTDEVLESIFLQFGLTPQQFDLRKARNVIPFLFFERNQQTAGEVIRKLMEAEMGRLWLDEDGIIRFIPRLEMTNEPVYGLNDSDIVSLNVSTDTQLINTVRITNRTRVVQPYQDVYKVSDDTRPEGVIPASSSRVYSAQLQDPALTIEPPTRGAQSGVSWFVAKTAGGTEVTSGITVIATELKTNSFEIAFANTNNFSVQITDMQLFGQPAKIINPNDPEQIFEYPPSIEKYEGQPSAGANDEGGMVIENNFIQTFSQAQSLAVTILDDYAEYAAIVDCEIKGNPALQLGDVVELNYRQYTGNYRIIGMSQSLQPGRFVQNLKLRKYEQRQYFALNVSQLNGPAVLAP